MKNGVLEETDGFDIVVNSRNLTFRDARKMPSLRPTGSICTHENDRGDRLA
jgi:hypothetical protein